MKKEEKAFLVVLSILIGTLACFIFAAGDYFSVTASLLLGVTIAFSYPILILTTVKLSIALKRWAYQGRVSDHTASGQQTVRAYLFILLPVLVPFLMIFYVIFGVTNRLFKG